MGVSYGDAFWAVRCERNIKLLLRMMRLSSNKILMILFCFDSSVTESCATNKGLRVFLRI